MPAVIGRCVLALGLLLGAASPAAAQGERVIERPDFEHYFAEAGTRGTIVVHDLAKDVRFVVNPTRAATGYLPASTFKILNALAGLSAGAVRDPDGEAFISDGDAFQVDGKPLLPPQCTGELTLRAAFRYSCIPVFQEVARRVGLPRFRYLLAQIGYGNGDITSAPVDSFWLEGGLRVTAYQQVRLLEQLLGDDLPFTRDAMIQVKDMMVVEDKGGTVIRAKTGYVTSTQPRLGWWVGWVDQGGHFWVFALNLDVGGPDHLKARQVVAKSILHELGVLP